MILLATEFDLLMIATVLSKLIHQYRSISVIIVNIYWYSVFYQGQRSRYYTIQFIRISQIGLSIIFYFICQINKSNNYLKKITNHTVSHSQRTLACPIAPAWLFLDFCLDLCALVISSLSNSFFSFLCISIRLNKNRIYLEYLYCIRF